MSTKSQSKVSDTADDLDDLEISDVEDNYDDILPSPLPPRPLDRPMTADDVLNKIEAMLLQSKVDAQAQVQKEKQVGRSRAAKDARHSKHSEAEEDAALLADEMQDAPIANVRIDKQPPNFQGEMRDYQLEALNWMMSLHDSGLNGILADEMGLGKTCETISLLAHLRAERHINGKHLIIVPKSTLTNWSREIARFCPDFRVLTIAGPREDRETQKLKIPESDIIVTTYEVVIIERAALRRCPLEYIIIDEAHRIKNENSKLSLVVRQLKSKHRLLITGTPLQNNLHELWALLNFLKPEIFKTASEFQLLFDAAPSTTTTATSTDASDASTAAASAAADTAAQDTVIKRLHRILRPFLLRRLKTDVATSLPPKIETKLYVGLSALQRDWYTKLLARDIDTLNTNASNSTKTQLLNMMMQLRKVCNHPYLFDGAEPEPFVDGEHLIENCGKMVLLDKLLKKLKQDGSRVLIFSQMTRLLDILEDYCRYRSYNYCRIDGSTRQEDRDAQMDAFNAPNSEKFIFLLSTRAGGLGINLQTADTVILYDSDWNPQMDLQAMDRAHRIGQKKQVNVFRLVTEGTVEEKIIERATRKLALDAMVVQKGRLLDKEKQVGAQELQNMVRFGAAYIFSAKGSTVTDDDIDAILRRGKERTQEENSKIQAAKMSLSNFSLTDLSAQFNTLEFEGTDYSATKGKPQPLALPSHLAPPQRERKTGGAYDVNKYYKDAIYGPGAHERKLAVREFRAGARHDFQFLDDARLTEIEQMLFDAETRYRTLKWMDRLKAVEKKKGKPSERRAEKRKVLRQLCVVSPECAARAREEEEALRKEEEEERREEEEEDKRKREDGSMKDEEAEPKKKKREEKHDDKDKEKEGDKDGEKEEEDMAETDPVTYDRNLRLAAQYPSDEILAEQAQLLEAGFPHWRRADLNKYIAACATFGRDDVENVALSVEGKTPEEVKAYHSVFWKRYKEIKDWDKLVRTVEKGESALRRVRGIDMMLRRRVKSVSVPLWELPVSNLGRGAWSEEEDRWLLCCVAEHGYGNWGAVRREVLFNPYFRCNLFMRTRGEAEIKARGEALIRAIEKEERERDGGEVEEEEEVEVEEDGKKKSLAKGGKKTEKTKSAASASAQSSGSGSGSGSGAAGRSRKRGRTEDEECTGTTGGITEDAEKDKGRGARSKSGRSRGKKEDVVEEEVDDEEEEGEEEEAEVEIVTSRGRRSTRARR